jgi:hypothetical protein
VLGRRAAARGGDSTAFFSSLSAFSFVAVALEVVVADGAGTVPVMVACRLVSSRIIVSLSAALSACTVCACCRRLSSRENCLEQWQVKGRSPVCFLDKRKEKSQHLVETMGEAGGEEEKGICAQTRKKSGYMRVETERKVDICA